jgi:alpha-amylase
VSNSEEDRLLFGIHCHQPVGNFSGVVEGVYRDAYRPTLETLAEFPAFRFVCHYSGPLLEWLERHHPEHLGLLVELARRGQLELLGGGFYEPVLAVIPPRDRRAQLARMQEFWAERTGVPPRGAWLAERVWSPELAEDLAAAGIAYVLLDDYHFRCAGLAADELTGAYRTEAGGRGLTVLPISQKLRYLVPFHPVEEVVADLAGRRGAAVLVDDGEKFGAWPGTREWVHERGWLRRFLAAMVEHPDIRTARIGDYLAAVPTRGFVYLPTTSYAEMGEWSLPAAQAARLAELRRQMGEAEQPLLRGGTFPFFFAKYPEGGYLRQRVLAAGAEARGRADPAARRHLLRAQCNDAYWHGVFGGIYLPHLRRALWGELLAAEAGLKPAAWAADLDGDGFPEHFFRTGEAVFAWCPRDGGVLRELSLGAWGVNLGDVLARRLEAYHLRPEEAEAAAQDVATIHERGFGVQPPAVLDSHRLSAFRDSFWVDGNQAGGFAQGIYRTEVGAWSLLLQREEAERAVAKEFQMPVRERRFAVRYRVRAPAGETFRVSLPLALPAGDSPAGELMVDGRGAGGFGQEAVVTAGELAFRDRVVSGELRLRSDPPAVWRLAPVRTPLRTERGAEAVMQGLDLSGSWELTVGEGEVTLLVSWDRR